MIKPDLDYYRKRNELFAQLKKDPVNKELIRRIARLSKEIHKEENKPNK